MLDNLSMLELNTNFAPLFDERSQSDDLTRRISVFFKTK